MEPWWRCERDSEGNPRSRRNAWNKGIWNRSMGLLTWTNVYTEDRVSMSPFPSTFFSILLQEYSINFRSICVCICIVCMHVCRMYSCICKWWKRVGVYAWSFITHKSFSFFFFFFFFVFLISFIHKEISCLSFLYPHSYSSIHSSSSMTSKHRPR